MDMAYDRFDPRRSGRNEGSRWSGGGDDNRGWSNERGDYGRRDERGFFERAGDQISSWFGDDDDDRPDPRERGHWDRPGPRERGQWDRETRERDTPFRGVGRFERDEYRPVTGDYGRSDQSFGGSGRGSFGGDDNRPFRTARQGQRNEDFDPHYHSWRERQISELDRDYDEYRRENQSRFEREFSSWREQRQRKRALLGQIREHMEVIGSDSEHVGTIDRVAGDRIILARSDPESGGAHHSLSCADIAGVDNDNVTLECTAEQARQRWRDDDRSRALFEREDQGEMGPRILDRSFEGTYR